VGVPVRSKGNCVVSCAKEPSPRQTSQQHSEEDRMIYAMFLYEVKTADVSAFSGMFDFDCHGIGCPCD
jgi:hypothetical protein